MDAQFRDRAAYLPGEDALVVADLHVGRDAASAVELPLGERRDLTERLADLLAAFDPATVVVAGDLLHAFDRVPEGVAETVAALRETVAAAGASLVVVRGNHDSMLDSVLDEGAETPDEHRVGDTVVHHGHATPTVGENDGQGETEGREGREVARYVVGHDHPAIEIEGKRHPCLLFGPGTFRGADVLVLPAFNRLAPGTTVNGMRPRDFQTPLVTDVDALRPVVWDADREEALSFPPLGEFRRML
ncbi:MULTISPECIES: metallophosphoesterase [Halorussus]|uniref:metallophosphoesterase n=1 Tax=Halorussus TaxID=1070314 RepID=UPI000E20E19A|nr:MULTISPECIES: metallophosphoesterase [Halorussus]NHN58021.1 metallophosphoesterase [Halorussus sp. JP-T4]